MCAGQTTTCRPDLSTQKPSDIDPFGRSATNILNKELKYIYSVSSLPEVDPSDDVVLEQSIAPRTRIFAEGKDEGR